MAEIAKFNFLNSGITHPTGFKAGAVACGIAPNKLDKLDLALLFSAEPCVSAGVFTQNKIQAAPVIISKKHMRWGNDFRAIIANSGNANACTGKDGIADAQAMAKKAAKALGIKPKEVAVCSTGKIGKKLPIELMLVQIDDIAQKASNGVKAGNLLAQAIMTSDTKSKESAAYFMPPSNPHNPVNIGIVAKGAGMIQPNMATMLCFITTDANINKKALKTALAFAVDKSFNRISIDGDMSTNDSVIALANGCAKNEEIKIGTDDFLAFQNLLEALCKKMARAIVLDGEATTKLVTVKITNASSEADAEKVARAVANSTLVKCSWAGSDPNWGRIMDAIGYSEAKIKPSQINILFGDVMVAENSQLAQGINLDKLKEIVQSQEFVVEIQLNNGKKEFEILSSDLTEGYVKYNLTEFSL